MFKKIENLQFHQILNQDFHLHDVKIESAWLLIKETWTRANRIFGIDGKVFSDDFLHSDICGLFDGDICVALMLAKVGNIQKASFLDQKYFSLYDELTIKRLHKYGSVVDMWHKITIHSDWSKTKTDLPILDVLFGLMLKRFQMSEVNFAFGLVNKRFKIENSVKPYGVLTIRDEISVGKVVGEALVATREVIHPHLSEEINYVVNKLWEEGVSYERNVSKKNPVGF